MSSLSLNIDLLKFPVENDGLGSTEDSGIPSGYSPNDYRVFLILNDYLQPEHADTVADSVGKLLDSFPDRDVDLRAINNVACELAEQIPWDHPSQMKLVQFIAALGADSRRAELDREKHPDRSDQFYQRLFEAVVDNDTSPEPDGGDVEDGSSTTRHINFQAFLAKLVSSGTLNLGVNLSGGESLGTAFEAAEAQSNWSPEVKDGWITGAAQWILWSGQRLFDRIASPDLNDTGPGASIHDWERWRDGFLRVTGDKTYGEACRNVAQKAGDMMTAIEKELGEQ